MVDRYRRAHGLLRTAAVTGTNGKTTTTSMIAAIVGASGEPSARMTTVGAWIAGAPLAEITQSDQFLDAVEKAADLGVRTLALEVTSKALMKGLAKQWPPQVAVFTNLTRDHMDMHGSPEAYLAAKAQLFMVLGPGGVAVLNRDDPSSELILEVTPKHARVVSFSVRHAHATLAATEIRPTARGTTATLAPSPLGDALGGKLELSAIGGVHVQNALAAALACDALGYGADAIAAGLRGYQTVSGRFEVVAEAPLVVVDYAHTPDGLDGTLRTAREIVTTDARGGRVICVFGCGGGRDRGKRPQMGAIADRHADLVLLTTDNPRFEDPVAIAAEVQGGVREARAEWIVELDRRAAIDRAIAMARPEDLVVIAGKGHETTQEVRGVESPFSDAEIARAAVATRA